MTRYSFQPREILQLLVKGYGFLCFAKNIDLNTNINITKNLSSKYNNQTIIDCAKQSATDALKTA